MPCSPAPGDGLQFLDRPGTRLAWRADGDPDLPALVFGNSLGSDHRAWDRVLPRLVQRFRVIRFDARGHGASTVDAASRGSDYSIAMLAGDALAVADAAGAARFHYVGLSIGGMVGMWLGQHAAQRLRRLVLSNTAARLSADLWNDRMAAVRAGGMAALADATLQRWFTPTFHAREAAQVAATRAVFLQVDVDGYLGCAAAIRDMDLRDALPQIHTPTLVITGSADSSTPPALGREIAARISGAACRELQAAHMPPLEQPEAFAAAVEDFLSAD